MAVAPQKAPGAFIVLDTYLASDGTTYLQGGLVTQTDQKTNLKIGYIRSGWLDETSTHATIAGQSIRLITPEPTQSDVAKTVQSLMKEHAGQSTAMQMSYPIARGDITKIHGIRPQVTVSLPGGEQIRAPWHNRVQIGDNHYLVAQGRRIPISGDVLRTLTRDFNETLRQTCANRLWLASRNIRVIDTATQAAMEDKAKIELPVTTSSKDDKTGTYIIGIVLIVLIARFFELAASPQVACARTFNG